MSVHLCVKVSAVKTNFCRTGIFHDNNKKKKKNHVFIFSPLQTIKLLMCIYTKPDALHKNNLTQSVLNSVQLGFISKSHLRIRSKHSRSQSSLIGWQYLHPQ